MLASIASAATTYLLYAMAAVPFCVWSGRATYNGMTARGAGRKAWPGRAATLFFCLIPAGLIAWFLVRGFRTMDPLDPFARDEWGQVYFLIAPPCLGLMLGYALGVFLARRP